MFTVIESVIHHQSLKLTPHKKKTRKWEKTIAATDGETYSAEKMHLIWWLSDTMAVAYISGLVERCQMSLHY